MSLIDNPDHARRLARAIISDVALYNREKVEEGIKNDNIFQLLAAEIEEGRQHYLSRVAPELVPEKIFELAIVDVLIKRAGKIESSIW
jgi:spore germination protein GerM